jgi:predicted branched-subunit amino acid permease
MTTNIVFTSATLRRGMWRSLPLVAGLAPFGFVTGLITQRHGLTLPDCMLMNALVYAGAAQLVALANWTHPAPILAAAFAAFVVNMRFALMGPVLAPWLSGLSTGKRYAALSILVDHTWALSVTDMRNGGRDVALFVGLSIPLWFGWLTSTTAGFLAPARSTCRRITRYISARWRRLSHCWCRYGAADRIFFPGPSPAEPRCCWRSFCPTHPGTSWAAQSPAA